MSARCALGGPHSPMRTVGPSRSFYALWRCRYQTLKVSIKEILVLSYADYTLRPVWRYHFSGPLCCSSLFTVPILTQHQYHLSPIIQPRGSRPIHASFADLNKTDRYQTLSTVYRRCSTCLRVPELSCPVLTTQVVSTPGTEPLARDTARSASSEE